MRMRFWSVAAGVCVLAACCPLLAQEAPTPQVTAVFTVGPGNGVVAGNPSEARIRAALEEMTSVDMVETPLEDCLNFIAGHVNLDGRIVVDRRALNDAGVGTDTPVTLRVNGIRARSALELVLEPLELDWTIREDVLFVTTQEAMKSLQYVITYPVADLLSRPRRVAAVACCAAPSADPCRLSGSGMGAAATASVSAASGEAAAGTGACCSAAVHTHSVAQPADELIDAITSAVLGQTWDEVGGTATINVINAEVLVISQTRRGHDGVTDFLAKLRQTLAALPPVTGPVVATANVVHTIREIDGVPQAVIRIEPAGELPGVAAPRVITVSPPTLAEPLVAQPTPEPTVAPTLQPTVVPTPE